MWQVNNPASGDVIASVARMGERETKDAIGSAYDAFARMDSQIIHCLLHEFTVINVLSLFSLPLLYN